MKLLIILMQVLNVLACTYIDENILNFGPKTLDIQGYVDTNLGNTILEKFDLLQKIPKFCTKNHTNRVLKSIYLSDTCTKELGVNLFQNYKLEIFSINKNSIRVIKSHTFYNISIISIIMNNCEIERLESEAFSNLRDLEFLDLSYNKIESLNSTSFKNLTGLKSFMINFNQLFRIGKNDLDFLKDATKINSLYFGNNLLGYIENGSFRNLKVFHISLENNSLLSISELAFINSTVDTIFVIHNYIHKVFNYQNSQICDIKNIIFEPGKELKLSKKMKPEEKNSLLWTTALVFVVIFLIVVFLLIFCCH